MGNDNKKRHPSSLALTRSESAIRIPEKIRRGRPPVVRWVSLASALEVARAQGEDKAAVEERIAAALGVGVKTVRHWVLGEFLPDSARLPELAGALAGEEAGRELLRDLVSDMPISRRKGRAASRQDPTKSRQ